MTNYNFYLRFFALLKSKYLYFLIFSCVISWQSLIAQTPGIEWQKSFGGDSVDYANDIQQTTDGGYIIAGSTRSIDGDITWNHGGNDFWIVKLDADATLSWQKCLGGSDGDGATSIIQTSDGGYIVVGGSTSNDGDITGNHGMDDCWIVKLDSNGSLTWQKNLGGSSQESAFDIQQTTDGGYIVASYSNSYDGDLTTNHGSFDSWIVKLDSSGNLSWQKSLGGSDDDVLGSIQQTTDGGYIVAGGSTSNDGDVTGNHGNNDFWVVKLASNGNLSWQKCLGGSSDDGAITIQQTIEGGYIVVGGSYSNDGDVTGNHGSSDAWVVKLAANGNLTWQKNFGGSDWDDAFAVKQTTDGGYIIAGKSMSMDGQVTGNHGSWDYWVIKLAANGNLTWQKCLGGSINEKAYSIQQTTDGGYIVAGFSNSIDGDVTGNHGKTDFWIVKLKNFGVGTEEEIRNKEILVYPNPFSGQEFRLAYSLSGESGVEIVVRDVLGKVVFREQEEGIMMGEHEKVVRIKGIEAKGVYFVELRTGDRRWSGKVVKE